MNVYDEAHRLAKAIKYSEENKKYINRKRKKKTDQKNKKMVNDFREKAMEVQMEQLSGKEVSEEKLEQLKKLQDILMLNPDIKDFFITEMRFSQMITDVYKILEEAINIGENQE